MRGAGVLASCLILSHSGGKGGQIKPKQYNNHAKDADQKLWWVRNQDSQKKSPTRRSINPLKQMDSTENTLRTECPGENAQVRMPETVRPSQLLGK